jgi:hypothetical protein
MAAQMLALLTLCRNGDHIVAARTLYGGTYSQLAITFAQFGIDVTFVDADDPDAFRRALTPRTKAVYAETIGNPQLNVCDIAALAEAAHGAGIPLVLDNTLASPFLCRPIEHGADIVIHSVTKYLGGHGTTMGGIVVESGRFPWDNGNFPQMTEPSRGYHGVRFWTFGDFGFTMKADGDDRTLGPTWPLSAFLPAGHRDAASGCRGTARRRWPWRHLAAHPALGELPAAAGKPVRGARAAIPAARRGRHPDLRRARRRRRRRALQRGRAVPLASRQHRRREVARHPPGVDDAPAALGGRAARRRRDARDDPVVGGARDAGRYTLGPGPGWSKQR